jgi:hypothetical protein
VDEDRPPEPYEPPTAEPLDSEDARVDSAACVIISNVQQVGAES